MRALSSDFRFFFFPFSFRIRSVNIGKMGASQRLHSAFSPFFFEMGRRAKTRSLVSIELWGESAAGRGRLPRGRIRAGLAIECPLFFQRPEGKTLKKTKLVNREQ